MENKVIEQENLKIANMLAAYHKEIDSLDELGDKGRCQLKHAELIKKEVTKAVEKAAEERDRIIKCIKYGEEQIEIYRTEIEAIKTNTSINEETRFSQLRLAQGKFYGWRDSIKFLKEAIKQSES